MKRHHTIFVGFLGVFASLLMVGTSLSFQSRPLFSTTQALPPILTTPSNSLNSAAPPDPAQSEAVCAVRFEDALFAGDTIIPVSGRVGAIISLTDLTTQTLLAGPITISGSASGYTCEGYIELSLSEAALVSNHMLIIEGDDGTFDAAVVRPTTTIPTRTPAPTQPVPTATPIGSFIFLEADCGFAPTIQLTIRGYNWSTSESVFLFWDDAIIEIVSAGHSGSFLVRLDRNDVLDGTTYQIEAISSSTSHTAEFQVPCPNVTPTTP